jgi:hypothetical protein
MENESTGTILFGGARSDTDVDYVIGMSITLLRLFGAPTYRQNAAANEKESRD